MKRRISALMALLAFAVFATGLLGNACGKGSLTVDELKVGDAAFIYVLDPFVDAERDLFLYKRGYAYRSTKSLGESNAMRVERRADGFHLHHADVTTDFRWRRVDDSMTSSLPSSDLLPVASLSNGSKLVYSAGDPTVGEVPLSSIGRFPVAHMRVGEVACLYSPEVHVDSEGRTYIVKRAWAYGQALRFGQKDGDGCDSYPFRIERTEAGFHATVHAAFTGLWTRKIDFSDEKYYPVVSLTFPERPRVHDPILKEYMPWNYKSPSGVVLGAHGQGARMPSAYLANFPLTQLKAGEVGFLGRDAVRLDKDRRMYIAADAEIYGTSTCQYPSSSGLDCLTRPVGLDTKDVPLVVLRREDGYHVYAMHAGKNEDQNYYARLKYRWGMVPESLAGNAEFVPVSSFVAMRSGALDFFPHLGGEAAQVPWKFVAP